MNTSRLTAGLPALLALSFVLLIPRSAPAHCDGMDGPVVTAARNALRAGDVSLVLVWVRSEDEKTVRDVFERTLAVRALGVQAQELADVHFFETVVRLHRAGEGAPYTGLRPAGQDLGPAIPLADRALSSGTLDPLLTLLTEEMRRGLTSAFDAALAARRYSPSDVEAGREYVRAYVTFIHHVERLHEATRLNATGESGGEHSH